jgi:hypothetical protein
MNFLLVGMNPFIVGRAVGGFLRNEKLKMIEVFYAHSFFMNFNGNPEGTRNKSFLLCLIIVNGLMFTHHSFWNSSCLFSHLKVH